MNRKKGDIILEIRINRVKELGTGRLSEELCRGKSGKKLSIRKKLKGDPEDVFHLLQSYCEEISDSTEISSEIVSKEINIEKPLHS